MQPPIDLAPGDQAPGAGSGREFGTRFLEYAEAENRRVLEIAYFLAAVLFCGALLAEHLFFGARFTTPDLIACGGFLLWQGIETLLELR